MTKPLWWIVLAAIGVLFALFGGAAVLGGFTVAAFEGSRAMFEWLLSIHGARLVAAIVVGVAVFYTGRNISDAMDRRWFEVKWKIKAWSYPRTLTQADHDREWLEHLSHRYVMAGRWKEHDRIQPERLAAKAQCEKEEAERRAAFEKRLAEIKGPTGS
jgi:hypothetical protein